MSKIGEQFSEFRKTAPKYVQWILLVAAIVIVVVLLMLLIGGHKAQRVVVDPDSLSPTPELIISPDGPIDWSNTQVGDTETQSFLISANGRAQITNVVVRVEGDKTDATGIAAIETCKNDQIIDQATPCTITIKFQPDHPITTTDANVAITWTAFDTGTTVENPNAITLVIGAHPKPATRTTPPAQDDNIENEEYDDPYYYDDSEFQEDINDIAAPINFDTESVRDLPNVDLPTVNLPVANPMNTFKNNCSDFSFPGYNLAGIQSGWIKPMGGAYYYHPFSDANCDTPTGVYNADTGYIMDIKNPSRKIGSDSEHIRFVVADRLPQLSGGTARRTVTRARQLTDEELDLAPGIASGESSGTVANHIVKPANTKKEFTGYSNDKGVVGTRPRDRSFVLRQYKPIPATIVSDIQADANLLQSGLPVRATVDRNVYSDNGRTVIIPTGTLMLGYVTGNLPGPYKAVGRMEIKWYQFIRPDGVEFNFTGNQPFAADSQGRKGVPGHGSTDYLQQFVMPMLTAIVPAAVNMIAPISDAFVNQIDLDNNTVVQSGTVRSSELAKNEIITAWNNVATKLLVDLMDNTTPPFSIAAGTRITVFSPVDLFVTCGDEDKTRKCAILPYPEEDKSGRPERGERDDITYADKMTTNIEELVGQVRSMLAQDMKNKWCDVGTDGMTYYARTDKDSIDKMNKAGYSFTTVDFYCRSFGTYEAINNAKQKAVFENQQQQAVQKSEYQGGPNTQEYNEKVLGLKYNDDGSIQNPFQKQAAAPKQPDTSVVTCDGGAAPDMNGCCPGETYTDMGDQGFNCCPDGGGDCFPPIEL